MVTNFLIDNKEDPAFFRDQILSQRCSNSNNFQYIANIFGSSKVPNKVSVYQGINYFGSSGGDLEAYASFYNKFINSAAIQTAKVSIEAINAQISVYGESFWKQINFSKIGADYYGPSC